MAVRTATGWSAGKWLFRILMWIPPFTPIGIWLSLRHHRWKAKQQTEEMIRKQQAAS